MIYIGILLFMIVIQLESLRKDVRFLKDLSILMGGFLAWIVHDIAKIKLTILVHGEPVKGDKMDLKVNDTLPVSLLVEDKFGNPGGALDAAPTWSVSDEAFGTFAASTDGLSGAFIPTGKLGSAVLQVAGAIAGNPVTGSLALNLITGDATQIVLQPGAPVAS